MPSHRSSAFSFRSALADFRALLAREQAPEWNIAFPAVLRFNRELAEAPRPLTLEEEELAMEAREFADRLLGEERARGRAEGEAHAREFAEQVLREERARGRAEGEARGRAEGLREAVEAACDLLGIELTIERRDALAAMDVAGRAALLARLRSEHRWS